MGQVSFSLQSTLSLMWNQLNMCIGILPPQFMEAGFISLQTYCSTSQVHFLQGWSQQDNLWHNAYLSVYLCVGCSFLFRRLIIWASRVFRVYMSVPRVFQHARNECSILGNWSNLHIYIVAKVLCCAENIDWTPQCLVEITSTFQRNLWSMLDSGPRITLKHRHVTNTIYCGWHIRDEWMCSISSFPFQLLALVRQIAISKPNLSIEILYLSTAWDPWIMPLCRYTYSPYSASWHLRGSQFTRYSIRNSC